MALPQDGLLSKGNKPSKPYEAGDADRDYRQSDIPQGVQESQYMMSEKIPNEIRAGINEVMTALEHIANTLSSVNEKLDALAGLDAG
jgi:hypothetical protein